ncbi:MAG TPA: murein L,D-transpeptidase catalytic domain family protein [Cyclobacteriaceae bacterium]
MHIVFSLLLSLTTGSHFLAENNLMISGDSTVRKDSALYSSMNNRLPLNRFNFDDSLQNLYSQIGLADYDLSFEIFRYGMIGYYALQQEGKLGDKNLLTIIDFTKSSSQKRFYTIDLNENKVKYYTYTSHGKNTGEVMASKFSNKVNSNQSSLGFYVTGETYIGSKGFSLKLDGKEGVFNDKMRERGVVIHEADYVSETWIKKYGRLGRSFGCPALPKELSKEIINVIKNKTPVFAYFNDETYLSDSSYLNLESLLQKWEEQYSVIIP